MGLGTFLLVQVGKAIIRIKPRELAKTLRRFKGSKEIKKPTDAQVDKSQTITGNLGNFNKVDRKIVANADRARPSFAETLFGTGRSSGQKIMKEVPTGESRRGTKKIIMSNLATAGVVAAANKDKKNKKTTKSTTKTYAQMVKEDKEKGKAKVLARRQPLPMSPKNKNRKEDPPKDSKKKVKPVEKKKVVTPPKKKKNGVTFEFKVGGKKDGR